jgi:hypothetical protein
MAVVTPNCAMASRSQTSSYRTLQNPEMKKKMKNQFMNDSSLDGSHRGEDYAPNAERRV